MGKYWSFIQVGIGAAICAIWQEGSEDLSQCGRQVLTFAPDGWQTRRAIGRARWKAWVDPVRRTSEEGTGVIVMSTRSQEVCPLLAHSSSPQGEQEGGLPSLPSWEPR